MTDGVVQPDQISDLQKVTDWAEYDPLWAARGKAIQGYAQLERSLCSLFGAVGDMSWKVAVTIFYKITNASARNAILEKLLHQKCGQKYNQFWNPYVTELRQIDLRRNAIVHWLAAANVLMNSEKLLIAGVTLIPPASVVLEKSNEHITTRDLVEFAGKCDEFARLASGLAMAIKPPDEMPADAAPSPDIFQQPLVYPLPEGHPYRKQPPISEIHPRSLPPSLQFLRAMPDGTLVVWNP